jgi:hypothetical protein
MEGSNSAPCRVKRVKVPSFLDLFSLSCLGRPSGRASIRKILIYGPFGDLSTALVQRDVFLWSERERTNRVMAW